MPAQFTLPPDNRAVGTGNPPADMNAVVDAPTAMGATRNVLNAAYAGGAFLDGASDSYPAIQAALMAAWNAGGGVVKVPASAAWYRTSKPLIIPPNVMLCGDGINATTIQILNNANCDVITFMIGGSTTQATQLGVSAGTLLDAQNAGVRDLGVDGNLFNQTVNASLYYHGISCQPSGGTDLRNVVHNVMLNGCSGNGFYATGFSAMLLNTVRAYANRGHGFYPSYDTNIVNCDAGSNGLAGFYINHGSNQGAGCKSWGCGTTILGLWSASTAYSVNNRVVYNNAGVWGLYICILAVGPTGTVPSADGTHWTRITAVTTNSTSSPMLGWGVGFFFDDNASEACFSSIDGQQNETFDFYFYHTNQIIVHGSSTQTGWNAVAGVSWAAACFDNSSGCQLVTGMQQAVSAAVSGLRIINGGTNNTILFTSDGAEGQQYTADSTGTASNWVVYNGKTTLPANVDIAVAGQGLRVAEGSNAKQGTAVLVTGAKVVSNTSVTANSRILLTSNADGGTPGWLRVSTA
jgi:hypothetical protein